jgi:hypothetical protein
MKSITILVAALYAFITQTIGVQSDPGRLFHVLEVMEGVSCLSFSKKMTNAIDIDLKDENKKFSGNLNQIHLMMYNPDKGKLPGDEFIQKAISLLPGPYKKFTDQDEKDSNLEIWMRGKRNRYTEFHLFIRNEEGDDLQFVVSFYGEFSLDIIKKLKKKGKNISADVG